MRFGTKAGRRVAPPAIPTYFWTRVKSRVKIAWCSTIPPPLPTASRTRRSERCATTIRSRTTIIPAGSAATGSIARHADVQRVSRDSDTFSNAPNPFLDGEMAEDDAAMSDLLISQDPPLHTKLRKLINKGFTPRRVARARRSSSRARRSHRRLARRTSDECDLVTDIALWLPLHVIADLVGVPEDDREQVFHWTELTFGFDQSVTPDERADAATAMYMYADGLCEQRRRRPARRPHERAASPPRSTARRLTQMQIDLFFLLLQNAGSETTRNLLTTGMIVLLQHPDQLERLRADPSHAAGRDRGAPAVGQPGHAVHPAGDEGHRDRRAVRSRAGERVVLVYPSANRDERAFDDPDRLDLTAFAQRPRRVRR